MDDYEKWTQELRAKSADELEVIFTDYTNAINLLLKKKQTIEKQLDMLYCLEPTIRRVYFEKAREENAKQQEKTL